MGLPWIPGGYTRLRDEPGLRIPFVLSSPQFLLTVGSGQMWRVHRLLASGGPFG